MSKLRGLQGSNIPAETAGVMKASEWPGRGISTKIQAVAVDPNIRYYNYFEIFGLFKWEKKSLFCPKVLIITFAFALKIIIRGDICKASSLKKFK